MSLFSKSLAQQNIIFICQTMNEGINKLMLDLCKVKYTLHYFMEKYLVHVSKKSTERGSIFSL